MDGRSYTSGSAIEGLYPRSYKVSARNALNAAPDDFNPYNDRTTSMFLPFSDPNLGPAGVKIFSLHGAVM